MWTEDTVPNAVGAKAGWMNEVGQWLMVTRTNREGSRFHMEGWAHAGNCLRKCC